MAAIVSLLKGARSGVVTATPSGENLWIKGGLIAVTLLFLGFFLFMPLAAVFAAALEKGLGAYWASFDDPDALAAIKLTLDISGLAEVPFEHLDTREMELLGTWLRSAVANWPTRRSRRTCPRSG